MHGPLPHAACCSTPHMAFPPPPRLPQVSAVSPKTNTTESTRLGAFTYGDAQVVLYDTPGVVDKQ